VCRPKAKLLRFLFPMCLIVCLFCFVSVFLLVSFLFCFCICCRSC
jgi:hypothetical protein